MDVTDALLEAADALPSGQPTEAQLVTLLRLHRHFASGDTARSVLAAGGLLWCLHALHRFGADSDCGATALEVVRALARSPVRDSLQEFTLELDSRGGTQSLSARVLAARVTAQRAEPVGQPQVVAIHCGGAKSKKRHVAALNADTALLSQLGACLDSPTRVEPGVRTQPIDACDPRLGLAGVGRGVFATRAWPAATVVGAYTAWCTTQTEFDDHVPICRRLEFESYAVTSRSAVRVDGRLQRLMFVAHPPTLADATSHMNDWRCVDTRSVKATAPHGTAQRGPTCQLVEVRHRGWLHMMVVTAARLRPGDELTVEYPDEFWRQRPRAVAVHDAIARAAAAPPTGDIAVGTRHDDDTRHKRRRHE